MYACTFPTRVPRNMICLYFVTRLHACTAPAHALFHKHHHAGVAILTSIAAPPALLGHLRSRNGTTGTMDLVMFCEWVWLRCVLCKSAACLSAAMLVHVFRRTLQQTTLRTWCSACVECVSSCVGAQAGTLPMSEEKGNLTRLTNIWP